MGNAPHTVSAMFATCDESRLVRASQEHMVCQRNTLKRTGMFELAFVSGAKTNVNHPKTVSQEAFPLVTWLMPSIKI